MSNKAVNIGAGLVGGVLLGTAVGMVVRNNPKMKVKRITKKTSQKLDAIGSMLINMSNMAK